MNHKHSFYRSSQYEYKCRHCTRWFFGVSHLLKLVARDPSKYLYLDEHPVPMGGFTRSFNVMVGER